LDIAFSEIQRPIFNDLGNGSVLAIEQMRKKSIFGRISGRKPLAGFAKKLGSHYK